MDKVKKVNEIIEVSEVLPKVEEILPRELITFNVNDFSNLESYKGLFKGRYNVDFIKVNDKVAIFEGKMYKIELRIV